MQTLPFLLPYAIPCTMIAGYATGDLRLFKVVSYVWFIVAVVDLIVRPDTRRPSNEQSDDPSHSSAWRCAVRMWVPVQGTVIMCGLSITTWDSLTAREWLIVTMSIGVANGMLCIPVAHDLMHGRSRFDKACAEFLMTTVSYPHFCIEHVHGHHRHIGTARDPATARLGESFYAFYSRTLFGSLVSAWDLEVSRLARHGAGVWSPHNRMLRYVTSLAVVYSATLFLFGWLGVAFFLVQSVIAFSTLELINYVEHYGLIRRETAPGRYEPVMPWHSWDSSHRLSNWMLFNLGRHADHHCHPGKSSLHLDHMRQAPQLPTGYFGMFLLPLVPVLWRRIMDPRVRAWRMTHLLQDSRCR
jgi:alkane 1-monooxygenase